MSTVDTFACFIRHIGAGRAAEPTDRHGLRCPPHLRVEGPGEGGDG